MTQQCMHYRGTVPASRIGADFHGIGNTPVTGPGPDGTAMDAQLFAELHVCCPGCIAVWLLSAHVAFSSLDRCMTLSCGLSGWGETANPFMG